MVRTRSIPNHPVRGFTLIEILVVITVIAISLAAIVPAFGRIIASANYSAAVNRVTAALAVARAEAMTGKQTAVAFLFDAQTERTTLLLVERQRSAGSLTRELESVCSPTAFVFVPLKGQAPILLPKGIGVYGLSLSSADSPPCQTRELLWYHREKDRLASDGSEERFWLFPRNDARLFVDNEKWSMLANEPDPTAWNQVARYADTFFVRFDEKGAILPSAEFGAGSNLLDAYIEFSPPVDSPELIANPDESPTSFDPEKYEFKDTVSNQYGVNREAQVRSVDYLAVVDLARLADETGVAAPWFVIPDPDDVDNALPNMLTPGDPKLAFVDSSFAMDSDAPSRSPTSFIHRISRWIDTNAEVIGFNRSTGEALRRVSP